MVKADLAVIFLLHGKVTRGSRVLCPEAQEESRDLSPSER